MIDKVAADALYESIQQGTAHVALSTLAAALQLEPVRIGKILEDADYIALAMSEAKLLKNPYVIKPFINSLQDRESPQRCWLHEKGVHSKKVTVPTWEAVLNALNAVRLAEDQKEQGKRDWTPAPPPETRKSARQRKKARR